MSRYTPEKLVAVSRYQYYFPTLSSEIQSDTYTRMRELMEEAALRAAGFSEVTSDHHPSKPWITVLTKK